MVWYGEGRDKRKWIKCVGEVKGREEGRWIRGVKEEVGRNRFVYLHVS